MLTGTTPFHGETLSDTTENIIRLKITWPNDFSPLARNLISKILKFDPKQRITLEQIRTHPFFAKVTRKYIENEENYFGLSQSMVNKANITRCYTRKESLSLFHKKSIDESCHPLLDQMKIELDSSNKKLLKLKNELTHLKLVNEELIVLNNTLSVENNSI